MSKFTSLKSNEILFFIQQSLSFIYSIFGQKIKTIFFYDPKTKSAQQIGVILKI